LVALGDPAAAAKDIAETAPKVSIVGKVQPVAADENAPEAWKTSQSSLLDEPWVCGPSKFSAPPAPPDAFPGRLAADTRQPSSVFLGKAVGNIHNPDTIKFWKKTFTKDVYVKNHLQEGNKIHVKMSPEECSTIYRERYNKSARSEMEFVCLEVKRLVQGGQVIEVDKAPICTYPLSVAFKVNGDGSIKRRLVIDLSQWINKFVIPDKYKMSRFQDALSQSSLGDFQSVYDISKTFHHICLHPESYCLVGFCVEDEDGKERFYHYVVVVFGIGPAGQALGRVMRPILRTLANLGIRNLVYVDDGIVIASSKIRADADYEVTLNLFKSVGLVMAEEKSDPIGASAQRKEYLGFLINMASIVVEVPELKMSRIRKLLELFLTSNSHKVREIASMVGKLNALEPALGKLFFVGTQLATIAVVIATEVSDITKRRKNPWESKLKLDTEMMEALREVGEQMGDRNGHPIRAWQTGIALSSILPLEATASLDRKIPARRTHDRKALMASNASDFAVASYSIEGIPEFSFSTELQDS
jgi:hypothetical protein